MEEWSEIRFYSRKRGGRWVVTCIDTAYEGDYNYLQADNSEKEISLNCQTVVPSKLLLC